MDRFSIGTVSLLSTILFPVLYLGIFQVRRLRAWMNREKGPQDRIWVYFFLASILGFVFGGFAQPIWDQVNKCRALGQAILPCVFLIKN